MTKARDSQNDIRQFILEHVESHPRDIARLTSQKFGISRQSVNRQLRKLLDDGLLTASGTLRNKEYRLKALVDTAFDLSISPELQEDKVWRQHVGPLLGDASSNVRDICHYGFTEMVNNVIDYSSGRKLNVHVKYSAALIRLAILDDGVGIFNKIQSELGLEDHRHVILELVKGKLTTDPERHTGEGIFFTSRMFDRFLIISGKLHFLHNETIGDWVLEEVENEQKGTCVIMEIHQQSKRTVREVFDKFTSSRDDYGFTRTHVPVALAQYEDENLVSRSQAKRLLARFDRFNEVFLDFKGVNTIGQAFADEIFRVFHHQNPQIRLNWINANAEVEKMIRRAITSQNNL
jgi:DNA-binding Lrp family transcriptional regulator